MIGIVATRLKKLKTHEGIVSVVGHILRQISNRGEFNIYSGEFGGADKSLGGAIEGQEIIGWKAFCQVFFTQNGAQYSGNTTQREALILEH